MSSQLEPGMLLLDYEGGLGGKPIIWTVKSRYVLIGWSEGVAIHGTLTRKPGIPEGMVLLDNRKLAKVLALEKGGVYALPD